jgi:hypothetical protein
MEIIDKFDQNVAKLDPKNVLSVDLELQAKNSVPA